MDELEAPQSLTPEELLPDPEHEPASAEVDRTRVRAIVEAVVYLTDQPMSVEQIASALKMDQESITRILRDLVDEYEKPEHGIAIREVAGGFAMATKPEHHDEVRQFVRNLQAPVKLSLPSLETLAVIAYKQPITAPEIMEIRGVQGAGVLKTLLDRKLIAAAGRKNVIGKPILYKTTREFLVQFGLKDMSELPSIKEFEEIRRMSVADEDSMPAEQLAPTVPQPPLLETPLAEGTDDGA